MCKLLEVSRSLVYYHLNKEPSGCLKENQIIEKYIKEIFRLSRNNYGTRKIKIELGKLGYQVSRKRIARIMRENSLVSNYTVAHYKVHKTKSNDADIPNLVDRDFDNRDKLEVIVSDLTHVRVGYRWKYVCTIIDLFNREIVGYVAGEKKDGKLIEEALLRVKYSLKDIKVFHSDRGKEYDNKLIDDILETFEIDRSLSNKGNPYDNAVSEATNKIMKIEFIYQNKFETLEDLELGLAEYVYWYNNLRIHGSLDYMTPVEYKKIFSRKARKVA